jgi:hypothetical protein
MSDFLTRLAQRQLGQVASVEPRLPGLFAPVAAATPLPIMEGGLARRSGAPPIATATADVMTSPRTMDSPAAVSGRHAETTQKLNPARHFATKSDEETLARGADVTFNMEFPVLVAPMLSAQGRSIDLSLADKSETVQPDLLLARPETRVSQEFSQRDAPPRFERAMPTRGEVAAVYRGHFAAESPVHVTIGRIEVTAVTATPTQRRAAIPRKPAMSLDDYLARRQRREP